MALTGALLALAILPAALANDPGGNESHNDPSNDSRLDEPDFEEDPFANETGFDDARMEAEAEANATAEEDDGASDGANDHDLDQAPPGGGSKPVATPLPAAAALVGFALAALSRRR